MIRRIIFILILALVLSSCGGAAPAATQAPRAATQAPAATEAPATQAATEAPAATEPPALQAPPTQATDLQSAGTPTPAEIQTETALPTLALPTEAVNAPAQMVWDGVPTYPGESTPGYSFRVIYNPDLWALTTDQFGFPALAHRKIPACIITVTSGRGLPPDMTVEHDVLYTGSITFDVGKVSQNGVLKFVTYTGGDGIIITGFGVSFEEQVDQCLADAVTVLSTLRSVPVSQATPQP